MRKQLLTSLALAAALLPAAAGAQGHRARVPDSLEPLIAQPSREIPRELRGPFAGEQGRERLAGREALSLHVRTSATRGELEALGAHVRTLRNGRATVTILPENLAALASSAKVESISLPRPLELHLSKSLPETGVPMFRTFPGNASWEPTGAGVVVGMIDSGIDFDHPNFKDLQGKTRIAYLLDQTTGLECTASMIDNGQCTEQDDPLQFGHGTHTTGIAAGNGAAPDENGQSWTHVGVAPESTIIFVKSKLQSDKVVDALEYIFAKADELGKPAVVNMSFGTDLGAHDGTDPMEQAIDDLVTAKPGRAVVVSSGNSRNAKNHAEVKAQAGATVAGPTIQVTSYPKQPGVGDDAIALTGYYNAPSALTIQVVTPSGATFSRSLSPGCKTNSSPDGAVKICNNETSQFDQATTAREVYIYIAENFSNPPPATGEWKINVVGDSVSGTGEVDFWMVSSLRKADGSLAATFSTLADEYETVSIPGTSREAITVGAYVTRVCWTNSDGDAVSYIVKPPLGDVAPFSNFGPTRDSRPKPEISAPGMGIVAPMAAEAKSHILATPDGPLLVVNDYYLLLQGTSMAAPHVAGALALILQYDPTATKAELLSTLSNSARDDAYTEPYQGTFTNYAFGAGKLDLGRWYYGDDHETNDLSWQASPILSGQLLKGYVERANDVDYFLLEGTKSGDTVSASLISLPVDYALSLQARSVSFDACSLGGMVTKATSNNAGTANESITYVPSGTQVSQGPAGYLRVTSPYGYVSPYDDYQIKAILTRPETTSAHNSTATAQELPKFVEMNVAGAIASGEVDLYRISVLQGQQIQLYASGSGKLITLLDANGAYVTSGLVTVSYTVPSGGLFPATKTYYVKMSGTNGGYSLNLKVQ
jgi:subtilisin family serine protease